MENFFKNIYASVHLGYAEAGDDTPAFMAIALICVGQILQLIFIDCLCFRLIHFSFLDLFTSKYAYVFIAAFFGVIDFIYLKSSGTETILEDFPKKNDKQKMKWRLWATAYIIGPGILSLILVWIW